MYPSPKNLLTDYAPRTETEGTTLGGWFDLDDWVGPQRPSKRPDIAKIEGILANSGDYSLERTQGPTGYWGLSLDDGIRKYQKRNGLKVDGTLRPGGPTIRHMQENFATLLDGHTPPTPEDIDAHHEVVGDDNPGTIAWRKPPVDFTQVPDLPEIDQEADASNARLARGMLKTGDIDSYAQLMRDAIEQGGKNGLAEVADLAAKLDEASPGLGGRFGRAIYDGMTKAQQDRIELKAQSGQPPGTVQVAAVRDPRDTRPPRMFEMDGGISHPFFGGGGGGGSGGLRGPGRIGPLLPVPADNENKPTVPPASAPVDVPNHTGHPVDLPEMPNALVNDPPELDEETDALVNEIVDEVLPNIFHATEYNDKRGNYWTIKSNTIGAKLIKKIIAGSDCPNLIKHSHGASENGKRKKYLKEQVIKIFNGFKKKRLPDLSATLDPETGIINSQMHMNTVTTDALGNPTPQEAEAAQDLRGEVGDERFGIFRKLREGDDEEAYEKEFEEVLREKMEPVLQDCRKYMGKKD